MLGFVYLTVASIVMAIMGFAILFRRVALFTHGARAIGQFTRWEIRGVRSIYYHPVIKFRALNGKDYEFVGGPGRRKKKEQSCYSIIYPADDPEKAMTLSWLAFWATPPAFFILSAASALAALQQYQK